MLEGLDALDWSILTHAHGPATDVPELLRSLLSEDPDVRLQAFAALSETIWHQGTVYPASAAAVPFLFELLTRPGLHDPGWAASLLGCIATGEGWLQYGLRVDGEPSLRRRLARRGRSLEEAVDEERAVMEAIHRDVAAGLEHLLPFLSDREGLGSLVAETLGLFPEHASWSVPAIDAALASEPDESVREVLQENKARLTNR
ncbi:hypothetical protein [Paludisphaera soli]|uniref:hypothetical protein n=1 Tax=Paludisphaera soli TaxID=2712865 RepID=UPI0013ED6F05|nr:hypothetical protein [Paludisphaera soli]